MNWKAKWFWWLLPVLGIVFIAGPRVSFEKVSLEKMPSTAYAGNPEKLVSLLDGDAKLIKPGNESRIIWADSLHKHKTSRVILYLHGFSASPEEGLAFSEFLGKSLGCNVYLPRLKQHGLRDINAFENLTPENYIQSAKDALDLCKLLGDSVILVSCSTGSTLGLILAARGENIQAHFMYSPNIRIADQSAAVLLWPWGKQLGKLVFGGDYHKVQYTEAQARYWYDTYHMNGIIALQSMLETYMTKSCFEKIHHPVFLAYYYQDEAHQDPVVSVDAMLEMYDQISTPQDQKEKIAFPGAHSHMMISPMFSGQMADIQEATLNFAQRILHWERVQ